MNTAEIIAVLRKQFAPPVYATLFEVRNGTGFARRQTRTADALVMGTWPSRGMELWGIEIKASRADWKRELDDPAKADEIMRFCDRWFLVVGDEKIVHPGELPPTWGLMVPSRAGLKTVTPAPKLEAQPLDRPMLAAILRVATDPTKVSEDTVRLLADLRKELQDEYVKERERFKGSTAMRLQQLQKTVDEFEQASGVHLTNWRAKEIGEAVKLIMDGGLDDVKSQLLRLHSGLSRLIAEGQIKADA